MKTKTLKVPTKQQIDAEIKNLRELIKKIPRRSFFGDDNHEKVKIQIRVLKERIPLNDVPDKFLYADVEQDEEPSDTAFDNESHARDAAQWLEGQDVEAPSVDWQMLVRK